MSYWQVLAMSAGGQQTTFGLEAPDLDAAEAMAQSRLPFAPASMTLKEIPPRCRMHGVRHNCQSSALELLFDKISLMLLASNRNEINPFDVILSDTLMAGEKIPRQAGDSIARHRKNARL